LLSFLARTLLSTGASLFVFFFVQRRCPLAPITHSHAALARAWTDGPPRLHLLGFRSPGLITRLAGASPPRSSSAGVLCPLWLPFWLGSSPLGRTTGPFPPAPYYLLSLRWWLVAGGCSLLAALPVLVWRVSSWVGPLLKIGSQSAVEVFSIFAALPPLQGGVLSLALPFTSSLCLPVFFLGVTVVGLCPSLRGPFFLGQARIVSPTLRGPSGPLAPIGTIDICLSFTPDSS